MARKILSALPLLMLLLSACSRPMSVEQYVKADGSGVYDFVVDMTDSLYAYDLSFYTRIEGRTAPAGFPMKVYLTSPSGQTYVENVYFNCSESMVAPYRTGLVPVERGEWKMSVSAVAQGLCGMGLICAKTDI